MSRSKSSPKSTPTDDNYCFVCGSENPIGLRTTWTLDKDGVARTRFRPERHHQGWRGVVHGGILAALLDEAMAQRMRLDGRPTITGSFNMKFRKPAPTGEVLVIEAHIVADHRRILRLAAAARSEQGMVYAEADGTCVRVRQ